MTSLIHVLYPGDGATCLVVNLFVQIAAAVFMAALASGAMLRRWPAAQHAVWLACLGFVLICPLTAGASRRKGMLAFSPLATTPGHSRSGSAVPGEGQGVTAPSSPLPPREREEVRAVSLAAPPDARGRGVPPRSLSGETPLLRDAAAGARGESAAAAPIAATEQPIGQKPEAAPTKVAEAKPATKRFDFRPLVAAVVGVWAAGMLFLTARLLHGILAVNTLRRTSRPLDSLAIGDVLADVRRSLGIANLPPIGLSERIATPVVAGLFRPAVLLPASLAAAIGQGRVRDVLLHECAHVARRDPWVVVLQRLMALIYWPHPLVHFMNRQLARCREEVCDNWVLRAVRPVDYADTLLEVAIHCRDRFGMDMPIGLFDVRGKVEDRVRRLLDRRRNAGVRLTARARWGVLAAAAIFLAVAASFPLVAPTWAEKQPANENQTAEDRHSAPVPAVDRLLPKTTVGYVSATNYPRLTEQWNKTQLGALMAKPVMKPFEDDLHAQLQNQWQDVADRIGIHLDDLRGVPTGEASLALIAKPVGTDIAAVTALLMDVTGNNQGAQKLLATAIKNLQGRGAAEKVLTVQGERVYVFDVPPAAGPPPAAGAPAAAPGPSTTMVYFLAKNVFCACDDLSVTTDIIGRLVNGAAAGSLSQVASYQKVMKRCAKDTPAKYVPNVRWFIYPLGYAEAMRAATPIEKRRRGKTIIEIMRNQGYPAFQAVGGYVDVSSDGYQVVHRTAVYAPKPWIESMKMFVFPAGTDFTPQPWVGRDVATYFTAYVDPLVIFDNFGPLYNDVLNAGDEDVCKTLDDLKSDPDGPQVDLRKDLVAHLGHRVTMVAAYQLPITTTSERLLWAIDVKNQAAVAKAIEKCVNNDPTIKKREIGGQVIWEIVEEEEKGVAAPTIELPGALGPKKEGKKPESDEEQQEGHFLPHGAFTVAQGQLFIASHLDFLVKTLKPIPADSQLATQKEFLKVWDITFNQMGIKQQSARSFSWSDRAIQPTYDMIRRGKMPQSESLLGRMLNSMAGAGKKGVMRHQRINGAKLPDFESVVAPALGPATASMTAEKDGWFVKGVLVTK